MKATIRLFLSCLILFASTFAETVLAQERQNDWEVAVLDEENRSRQKSRERIRGELHLGSRINETIDDYEEWDRKKRDIRYEPKEINIDAELFRLLGEEKVWYAALDHLAEIAEETGSEKDAERYVLAFLIGLYIRSKRLAQFYIDAQVTLPQKTKQIRAKYDDAVSEILRDAAMIQAQTTDNLKQLDLGDYEGDVKESANETQREMAEFVNQLIEEKDSLPDETGRLKEASQWAMSKILQSSFAARKARAWIAVRKMSGQIPQLKSRLRELAKKTAGDITFPLVRNKTKSKFKRR